MLNLLRFAALCAVLFSQAATAYGKQKTKSFEVDIKIKKDNSLLRKGILKTYQKETESGKYGFLNKLQLLEKKNGMVQTPLTTQQDVVITATIYIGSNGQPFELIMDTGSGNSWVISRLCVHCSRLVPKFDERTSSTFSFYPGLYDYHYGKGDVYCYDSFDQFCLGPGEGCTSRDFSFFTIAQQKNLDDLMAPGLVGLSPGHSSEDRGDRFILRLHEAGAIDSKLFSFFIDFSGQSQMTMGGINLEKFAMKGHDIDYHYVDQTEAEWWTLPLDRFAFGEQSYRTDGDQIIVDSGTTYVSIPESYRAVLLEALYYKGLKCDGQMVPACSGCEDLERLNLPPLNFTIGGKHYFIPWQNYVLKDYFGVCYLKMVTGQGIWILGLNFFENYYTVFDQEKYRVGFALSSAAGQEMVELHTGAASPSSYSAASGWQHSGCSSWTCWKELF